MTDLTPIVQPQLVMTDLACPWQMAWLPTGELMTTQRDRFILTIQSKNFIFGSLPLVTNLSIPSCVSTSGDGGLLGLAVDPAFKTNRFIYVSQTTKYNNGLTADGNQVTRFSLNQQFQLSNAKKLITWASNQYDNGGALRFGPDGCLYVLTGCAYDNHSSQSLISHNGKVLRLKPDGSPADGNPFANAIWAFGFKNPSGLTWEGGHMWVTDQGLSGQDEINLVRQRNDYGYPIVAGTKTAIDMYRLQTTAASLASDPHDRWGISGIAYYGGHLYHGQLGKTIADGIGAQALARTLVTADILTGKQDFFIGVYGRIRDVAISADGYLHFSTSNFDGVGMNAVDSIYKLSAF